MYPNFWRVSKWLLLSVTILLLLAVIFYNSVFEVTFKTNATRIYCKVFLDFISSFLARIMK